MWSGQTRDNCPTLGTKEDWLISIELVFDGQLSNTIENIEDGIRALMD